MHCKLKFRGLVAPLLMWFCGLLPALGVVVTTGIPNTTAPVGMPYFGNVGSLTNAAGTGTASAIFLGNRWVLTAYHVSPGLPGPGKVKFGGTTYNSEPGTWTRLQNPSDMGLSVSTDLVLFQITADPGLPTIGIRSAAPSAGEDVILVGNGRIQQNMLTGWDVTVVGGPANDIWTEVSPAASGDLQGYKVTAAQQVSWAVNELNTVGTTVDLGSYGDIVSITTLFNQGPGSFTQEGQAINGDSGGAMFFHDGSSWQLIGVMHSVDNYETQPYNTSIYGQSTYGSDLSAYREQIVTLTGIPEPSAMALILLATIPLIRRRR